MSDRSFFWGLAGLLALGLMLRIGYVVSQPGSDPYFAHPLLDGAYYLEWARDPPGLDGASQAYYLAPLYPVLLSGFFTVFGDDLTRLYLVQHLLILSTATLIALDIRRRLPSSGRAIALIAVALLLAYQPLLYFPSQPLSEPLTLTLLALALFLSDRNRLVLWGLAGAAAGFAALARPGLLLVPAAWMLGEALGRRWSRCLALGVGVLVTLLPVTARNAAVSGHAVLISSNAGITAYHGNGPGARGTYRLPEGFSGTLSRQRSEATALARARSGSELDAVEADRWWGRLALQTRLSAPLETVELMARKAVLLIDNYEHALDFHPLIDANPWRMTWRRAGSHGVLELPSYAPSLGQVSLVPFGLLFGLTASAWVLHGFSGSGGWRLWSTLAACAMTPLVFYMSSRYRLPLATFLVIPAAVGLVGLCSTRRPFEARRLLALVVGLACFSASILVPSRSMQRAETAASLANSAAAFKLAGDLTRAEQYARGAIEIDPDSALARFNLGVIVANQGRHEAATARFREALERSPGHEGAATNLAVMLLESGAPGDAVRHLRRALESNPSSASCWNMLVINLANAGDVDAARAAGENARKFGVILHEDVVKWLDDGETDALSGGRRPR